MGNLKVDLLLDSGQFSLKLDESKGQVQLFGDSADKAQHTVTELMNQMNKASQSTSNYRQKLAEMTRQLQDLTINYSSLTDAEKNSEFGKKMAAQIEEIKQKAAEFKDAVGDINAEITALSSDTANWDAIKAGIGGARDALSAWVAVSELAGADNDKLKNTLAKLAQIQTVCNAAISLGNLFNKSSIAILQIKRFQEMAGAAATEMQAAATGHATIAQIALNAACEANPYLILAGLLITVCTALYAFVSANDEAAEAEKKTQEEAEKLRKEQDQLRTTIANDMAKNVSSFKELQTAWKNLRTEAEKKQWIEDNSSAFNQLGLTVNDVTTADEIFVNNSANVIRALELRAQAAALARIRTQEYEKAYKKLLDAKDNSENAGSDLKIGDKVDAHEYEAAGGRPSDNGASWNFWSDTYTLESQAAIDKVTAYRKRKAQEAEQVAQREAEEAMSNVEDFCRTKLEQIQSELDTLNIPINLGNGKSGGTKGGTKGGNNNKPDTKPDEGSLQALKDARTELQKQLETRKLNDEEVQTIKGHIIELNNAIEEAEKRIAIAEKKKTEEEKSYYEQLKAELADLNKQRTKINLEDEDAQQKIADLDKAIKEVSDKIEAYEITVHIKAKPEIEIEPPAGSIAALQKKLQDLNTKIDIEIDPTKRRQLIQEVNDIQKQINSMSDDRSPLEAFNDGEKALSGCLSQANNLYNTWKAIGSEEFDQKDGIELFFAYTSAIFQTIEAIQALCSMFQTLNGVIELFSATSSAAASQLIMDNAAVSTSEATKASVSATAAVAQGVEAGSSAGWPAMLVAIPLCLAAVIAGLAMMGSFSEGGIVGGSSNSGDKLLSRLNSGEMVLNKRQQGHLYSMLNGGDGSGTTTFKIRGADLYATLQNYNNKRQKLL